MAEPPGSEGRVAKPPPLPRRGGPSSPAPPGVKAADDSAQVEESTQRVVAPQDAALVDEITELVAAEMEARRAMLGGAEAAPGLAEGTAGRQAARAGRTAAGSDAPVVADALPAADLVEASAEELADLDVRLALIAWDVGEDAEAAARFLARAVGHPLCLRLSLAHALQHGREELFDAVERALGSIGPAAVRIALARDLAEAWLYRLDRPERAVAALHAALAPAAAASPPSVATAKQTVKGARAAKAPKPAADPSARPAVDVLASAARAALDALPDAPPALIAEVRQLLATALGQAGEWAALAELLAADDGPAAQLEAAALRVDRLDDPAGAASLAARAAAGSGEVGLAATVLALELAAAAVARDASADPTELLARRLALLAEDVGAVREAQATRYLQAAAQAAAGDQATASAALDRLVAAADGESGQWGPRLAALTAVRLHAVEKRWPELAALYRDLADPGAGKAGALAYRRRAAQLLDARGGDRTRALELWRAVHAASQDGEAERAVERLSVGDRPALLALLESIARRDRARAATASRRAAHVAEVKGRDLPGALRLRRSAPPGDGDDAGRLEDVIRLLRQVGDHSKMIDAYRELAAQHGGERPDGDRVASAYLWAAGVLEMTRPGRDRQAEEALVTAARRAPRDLAVRTALAILYRRGGRGKELAGVLAELAALCVHPVTRYDLLRELGELYGGALGDGARARTALEEALTLRPDDTDVMHALARLHDQARDWAAAIALRRRAAEAITDRPRSAALWQEVGQIEETQRQDDVAALAAYLRAGELDPRSVAALQAAARMHRKAQRHPQLLELLRRERTLALAPDRQLPLAIEIAQLSEQAGEPADQVLAAWRDALAIDPKHEGALRGLEAAGAGAGRWELVAETFAAAPESAANLRALVTALGHLERWAELAESIGKLVGVLQDKRERAELCRTQAELYEARLADPDSAIRAWQRALSIDPADLAAQRALVRLLEAGGRWRDLVAALERELAGVPAGDADRQVALLVRIGELRRVQLNRLSDAAQAFEAVLERRPRQVAALDALEAIYETLARHKDLLRVIELRVDATDRPADRAALSARVAAVKEQAGDLEGAIEAYRRAFADQPDSRELFTALEGACYRGERWAPVMELYASVIERVEAGRSRAYRLADLYDRRAQVQMQYLRAPAEAAASFRRVLELEPDNDDAMGHLEQLHAREHDWQALIAAHEARAAATRDVQRKATSLRTAARTAAAQLRDAGEAARLFAALVQVAPHDAEALDYLERHYEAAGRWELLSDVLRARAATTTGEAHVALMLRIAQIGEEGLRDDDRAIEHYTHVLAAHPEHKQALDALARIYESTERWADFVDITRRQIKITTDRNMKALLYFKCGSVMEAKFGKEDEAIRYYDAAIKSSPACLPAVHGLRDLYLRRREWPRVIQTLELEVKLWQDDKERAGVFAQIGRIYAVELGAPERALHYFESALAVDPDCVPANMALFEQFFAAGEWQRAMPLAQALAQKAMRDGDPETRSHFFRKRGLVAWRTGDARSAAESIVIALEIKPTNIDALDALSELARAHPEAYDFAATFRELEKIYRKRDDAGPLQARVLVAQAAFLERDGDLDAADRLYAEAAARSPGDFAIVSAQVELHVSMRRFGHAVEAFARFLEGPPTPPREIEIRVLLKLAEIHADFEMDPHKAIRVLDQVLHRDETVAEAYYLRAQELYALGRFADARAAIERVIELSAAPASGGLSPEKLARYYYYLGRIVEASGDGRAAASQYRRAAEYDPGYAPPALALAMRTLDGGDQAAAESLLIDAAHAAMASGGEHAAVPLQRGLARILLVGRDRAAAIEAYRGILAVEPDNSDDRLALAEIYVHDDMARAIEEAKQVIERDLRHAPAYRLLASYYARAGETDRAARVLAAMESLGYADDADRRAAAKAMAEQSMAPLRHPLSDELRRRLLLTTPVGSPFGELLDAGAAEFAALFPEPPVGGNLVPALQEADAAFRVAVADAARLFGIEAEIYLGDKVPHGVVAMNFPRPLVVLDRELMADTDSGRRYALGWAFELLVGRYALLPMLGRRNRLELGGLMKSLFLPEADRPAVTQEFAARLPRAAHRVMERYQGMARGADAEEWIDGMLASARRAGLFACDDFGAALRVSARLNGENLGVGQEAISALGVVICGADLVRFYLSDEYHRLRESLTRPSGQASP